MQVTTRLKYVLKAPFRLCGLDLIVRRPDPLDFMRPLGIRTVLDVGAHRGVFAEEVRRVLPGAVIHAFEPLPEPFVQLDRLSKADANLHAWNVAVGAECGFFDFHVGDMTATSSFLPVGHMRAHFAAARVVSSVKVPMTTLDRWAEQVAVESPILLKADVQGFEEQVLLGATSLLERVAAVLLEVSFEELYVGQPLFDDIYRLLRDHGFVLAGMIGPIHQPGTGRQLQSNAIFCRPAAAVRPGLEERCA